MVTASWSSYLMNVSRRKTSWYWQNTIFRKGCVQVMMSRKKSMYCGFLKQTDINKGGIVLSRVPVSNPGCWRFSCCSMQRNMKVLCKTPIWSLCLFVSALLLLYLDLFVEHNCWCPFDDSSLNVCIVVYLHERVGKLGWLVVGHGWLRDPSRHLLETEKRGVHYTEIFHEI